MAIVNGLPELPEGAKIDMVLDMQPKLAAIYQEYLYSYDLTPAFVMALLRMAYVHGLWDASRPDLRREMANLGYPLPERSRRT